LIAAAAGGTEQNGYVVTARRTQAASLRKGWFRMIGTVVGATMIVMLTACFPQDRIAFLLLLALWGDGRKILLTGAVAAKMPEASVSVMRPLQSSAGAEPSAITGSHSPPNP
jgi:hypothetical protein